MLRQGLLRLASPTGEAADLIEDLGINVFDADGNIKELHDVVNELSNGLDGMSSQAQTAALATIFGSESVAGWTSLIERGGKELSEFTSDLEDSEGAASEMASIMQSNAKGAMIEFRSAVEGVGIALSEHMIPAVTNIINKGTDLVRKFGELDEGTQQNIIKMGLFAAAIGPVSMILGSLTTTIGGLVRAGGGLIRLLTGGGGLVGALTRLTSPLGIAITLAGALGVGVYALTREKSDLNEVNWELVESLRAEVEETDQLIDRFEELREKNQLSNDEMLRYMDTLTELERTSADEKIQELTTEQNELLEKSGLTNEEMNEFLALNDKIIEQAPQTAQAISEEGNAYAKNTDELRKLNSVKRREMMINTERELSKALENEAVLLREQTSYYAQIVGSQVAIERNQERIKEITEQLVDEERELEQLSQSVAEAQEEYNNATGEGIDLARQKWLQAREEYNTQEALVSSLRDENRELEKANEELTNKMNSARENYDIAKDELDTIESMKYEYEALVLAEAGLTAERGRGLEAIEEQLENIKASKIELEEQTDPLQKNTEEYRRQVNELNEQEKKLNSAKNELERINELAKEPISKRVDLSTNPTITSINRDLASAVRKPLYIDARANQIAMYADGTSSHPGGPFIAGEEGWELGKYRNQWEVLNAGLYDRPAGYQVFTHEDSKRILRSLNNIPTYATGTGANANRVVNQLNNPAPLTGQAVIYTTVINEMDGRELSRHTYRHITELQERDERVRESFA